MRNAQRHINDSRVMHNVSYGQEPIILRIVKFIQIVINNYAIDLALILIIRNMSRDNNWFLPGRFAIRALIAIHNSNICGALAGIAGAITGDRKEKLASRLRYLTTPRLDSCVDSSRPAAPGRFSWFSNYVLRSGPFCRTNSILCRRTCKPFESYYMFSFLHSSSFFCSSHWAGNRCKATLTAL